MSRTGSRGATFSEAGYHRVDPDFHAHQAEKPKTDPNYLNGGRSSCCGHHTDLHDPVVGCVSCSCQQGATCPEDADRRPIYRAEIGVLLGVSLEDSRFLALMQKAGIRFRPWSQRSGTGWAITAREYHEIRMRLGL